MSWQIRFPDGIRYVAEKQLEHLPEEAEDALDLLFKKKFGRIGDLRGSITHIRLSGKLADLIYSMETTLTTFYPYQFKPVLNFLDSPSRGILIADEVGLGKTIEAGLIWTELRSRYDARRLLVLCPAMLGAKWRQELARRFGIDAQIADASQVKRILCEYIEGDRRDFAIIASMQGLRPGKDWEEKSRDSFASASDELAFILNDMAYDEDLLDLLIIDEAHYLRNHGSMTYQIGRLLRNVAEHVVLLSATPVHLRSQDLYALLNLVDEDTFNQPHVFDDILNANAPLLAARDILLSGNPDISLFVKKINEAKKHVLLKNNRQLQAILDEVPKSDLIKDRSRRSYFAHRLEGINLLGHAVTRTRKRDVTEWRVVREAVAENIPMTLVEEEFYERVTGHVRDYCSRSGGHEGFLMVTPQRQISSSMPAALRDWQRRKKICFSLDEDIGSSVEDVRDVGPLVQSLLRDTVNFGNLEVLWENDSKYHRLFGLIKKHLQEYPFEKIVLFSYFRPTLYYLHERLMQDGIRGLVLVGGMPDTEKNFILKEFKDPQGPSLLLASEVASEGIDLQFARILVNYDLPWNPMRVEQRIGRIDRLGQESSKITVWNLFYENTIDARIYDRLYSRLKIFEYALGGMETVLGEEIKKMTLDLMGNRLSPSQEEDRIRQTAQALNNLKVEEDRLERDAGNLMAHGDFILRQIQAARDIGRSIQGNDLWIYTRDFLEINYKGCLLRQLESDNSVFELRLSEKAYYDLDRFMQDHRLAGQTRILQTHMPFYCEFKNQVQHDNAGNIEFINQFHPLIRFIGDKIKEKIRCGQRVYHPLVGVFLDHDYIPELPSGDYFFYVELWSVKGIRDVEKMAFSAKPFGMSSMLKDEDAEKLVVATARFGKDWPGVKNDVNTVLLEGLFDDCVSYLENRYNEYIMMLENENNDRADLQEKTLKLHMERQIENLSRVLKGHEEKGLSRMVPAVKGKMAKLETKVGSRLRALEAGRRLVHEQREICAGVLRLL
ncbi:SNF2 domain-containing protein [Desulfobotulus alkaliphilus]|uniref:SNF2 domain-containing protein n=1 Tax=Desulfobotulus alkaliphilus TaxID=622671 RepID=A0A562RY21_9BACT|nr:SNF2-related protein [Desulfobotulus alkaliphilus]TWI73931.1 SNF2 domain-containing protein [Desulfobotulus alkaliphilus]